MLGLGIMYVHFRQIASGLVSSRSCEFVVLDKLAVVVNVSWLKRHLVPRRQRPRCINALHELDFRDDLYVPVHVS